MKNGKRTFGKPVSKILRLGSIVDLSAHNFHDRLITARCNTCSALSVYFSFQGLIMMFYIIDVIKNKMAAKRSARESGAVQSGAAQQTDNCNSHAKNKGWRAVPSSKFVSHRAQLNALNEAMTREARNMPRFTGEDSKGNLVVRMEAKNVGIGYEPNPLDPANPRFIPEMNAFEMKFDFETLQPIALYPIEKI